MNDIPRRNVLAGLAAGAATSALILPGSAQAATSVYWTNEAKSADDFWVEAQGAPYRSSVRVTWTDGTGAIRTVTVAKSTYQYSQGWHALTAVVVDRRGKVIARTTMEPPVVPSTPAATIPAPAAALGMTRQALGTRFTDLSRIDLAGTGSTSFDWFTNYTWNSAQHQNPYSSLSIRTDEMGEKYLHIDPDVSNCNWSLSTFDQAKNVGKHFTYGYFEATIRYDQIPVPTVWSPADWPSFWLASVRGMLGIESYTNGEIDILEALDGPDKWTGALHEWPGYGPNDSDHHYAIGFGKQLTLGSSWHKFAAAWERPDSSGLGRVTWYVDGVTVATQPYSPTRVCYEGPGETCSDTPTGGNWTHVTQLPAGTFSCLNEDKMTLVVGTGADHPMGVKDIQVWAY